MNYVGWPPYVNQRIIDATTASIGNGGTISDNIEDGSRKKKRLVSLNPSDSYSVVMHFNWSEIIPGTGKTEYDLFTDWFKTEHKMGTVPFQFPAIMYNTNDKPSFSVEEYERTGVARPIEWYIIDSDLEVSKHGYDVEVKMTWVTWATGVYEISYTRPLITGVIAKNGYLFVTMATAPNAMPTTENFRLRIDGTQQPIGVYGCDEDSTSFYITFQKITEQGNHAFELTAINVDVAPGVNITGTIEVKR